MKFFLTIFTVLLGLVFFVILVSFLPEENITFTNLPQQKSDYPKIEKDDPTLGSHEPSVLIFHYGDFSNASSKTIASSLTTLAEEFKDIAIVWKDFPNTSLHEHSLTSAIAAQCAQDQEAFWEYHDLLFMYQDSIDENSYEEIAQEVGVWKWRFNRCLKNTSTQSHIEQNIAEAQHLNISAAPTLFINGERYTGRLSTTELRSIIHDALNTQ